MKGKNNPNWKGGIRDNRKDGYIKIYAPTHPFASKHGRSVFEHRLVMESYLGRYLKPTEIVHHINGITWDNRIENLELLDSQRKHARTHKRKRDKMGRFL